MDRQTGWVDGYIDGQKNRMDECIDGQSGGMCVWMDE